jgi:hypothetical protein
MRLAAGFAPRLDCVKGAHDIIEMLPDGVHAEVIHGEVIVTAGTPPGRHAKIVLAVRRAFARQECSFALEVVSGARLRSGRRAGLARHRSSRAHLHAVPGAQGW